MLVRKCLYIALVMLMGVGSQAVPKVSFLSVQDIDGLQSQFRKAKPFTKTMLKKQRSWMCEIFGVRSKVQKPKLYSLYKLKSEKGKSIIDNRGSQSVKTYKMKDNRFFGELGPLRDELRMNPDGSLISELSILKTRLKGLGVERSSVFSKGRVVITYAKCK